MSFFRELRRRNVVRVATAYIVTAWLIIQVVETIFPAFGFTDKAIRIVVIVLGIGFVPAVVGAWVFELTPEGLKRDAEARSEDATGVASSRIFDRTIVVTLLLGIVYFALDKFVLAPERAAEREAEVAEQAVAEAAKGFYGDRSIAVLPFDNMSADTEQMYFVDGVTEEILNLLASIRDLRVISRSSSFAFRGQGLEVPDIAERLDVAHVLEGSVRRAGNRVRVTAQLIEARTDTHMWSKSYERELDDVFLIQDEIAADVVRNLKLQLRSPLPRARRTDPEVLALVQQAKQIFEIRDENSGARMHALLERALELDPEYPPAIIWLSNAEFLQWQEGTMPQAVMWQRWQVFREQLLRLDPASGWVEFSDAFDLFRAGEWEQAAQLYTLSLDKDLTNSLSIRVAGLFALKIGRLDVAQRLAEHAVAIDPMCFQCLRVLSQVLMLRGDYDGALEIRSRFLAIASGGQPDYSMMLILSGQPEKVAAVWEQTPDDNYQKQAYLAMADHTLGNAEAVNATVAQLEKDLAAAREGGASGLARGYWQYLLAQVHAWIGNPDRAFELLMPLAEFEDRAEINISLFHPVWREIRHDPRWDKFREALGMSAERFAAIEFDPQLPD